MLMVMQTSSYTSIWVGVTPTAQESLLTIFSIKKQFGAIYFDLPKD